jgi:ankyrin repeat protein
LRYAAVGDIQGIQKLISDGLASPGDVGASYGMTALHVAFVRKDIDLCRFLVQHHADPSYETSLRRSVIDIVRDEGINGKISDELLSQLAVVFNEIDDYESFQLSPLHKSILGISPLDLEAQLAASTVYIDTPDSLGRTALSAAAWRGDASAVRGLLEYGASPNVCTPTELSPLHRAIESHSYECVELLLAHGADVNHQNKRGRSPLHYACRIPDGNIAQLLLERGANVNAEDHGSSQPLHECVIHNRTAQLDLILPHVADVDSYTADGKTAVHLAICNDNLIGLGRLLDAGADFQKSTRSGSTSLHMAACSASLTTVKALSEIDGLSLNVNNVNLAGAAALDVLESNPNNSPEFHAAFLELQAKLEGSGVAETSNVEAQVEDLFEDALSYQ